MELASAVLQPIIDKTVGAIGRQIGYVYHYTENIQNFRHEVEELSIVIGNIQGKIEDARTVGDIIRHDASHWQAKATHAKVDAENFLNEKLSDGHQSCLKGLCPNICSRHALSKEAKKKTTDIVQLVEHGNMYQTVSLPAPLPRFESRAGDSNFEIFESRKSVFEDIMHWFKDEAVGVIGIYGTGGVGKTAMADKVGAQAEKDHIFDEIVKVVVTKNLDVGKIQDELAAQLNLKLDETTVVGKAIRLHQRLTNAKKILLIVDDVWRELDLNAIGIPFENGTNGCQILLTTRSERVCQQMNVDKKIRINFLSGEEAWNLFTRQIKKGIPPDLYGVAIEACNECGGLPIAILAVGSMLNGVEDSYVWGDVLEQLRQSQLKCIPEIDEKVYASLAVSYHMLKLDEAKSCFLFCCLFPEDFDIPIEYILRFGKGVGVPQEMDTLSKKRDRVHYLVHYLKSNCLLLEGRDEEHVRMHDVIRDVAISIASEGQHVFLSDVRGDLKERPRKETYDRYTAISMNIHEGRIFPDNLDCAKLNTLLLYFARLNNPCRFLPSQTFFQIFMFWTLQIPQTFFHGMTRLKVLILMGMRIRNFPKSIKSLVHVEVLCLEDCRLGELSWVGNLKKLEMLILQASYFKVLPAEISELSHLRLLDLRDCDLKSISPSVISSLSRLEELFLPLKFWPLLNFNFNWAELKALTRLVALEMHVPSDSKVLPQDFGSSFWANLTKFRISINNDLDEWHQRGLMLKNTLKLRGVSLSGWAKVLSERVEKLYVEELDASEEMLIMLCDEGLVSFSKLLQFEAIACDGITKFLSMVVTGGRSFSRVSVIKVVDCNLECILSPFMVEGLPQLQTLEITRCNSLESIVGGCHEVDDIEHEVVFRQLRVLKLSHLRMLESFYHNSKKGCASRPLFTEKVGLPMLRELILECADSVKEIWTGGKPPAHISSFCNLTRLKIIKCDTLVRAIPPFILPSLHQLNSLQIQNCNSLREFVGSEAALGGGAFDVFPNLRHIYFSSLPKLENFLSLSVLLTFQCLSCIEIVYCSGLSNLFSSPSTALACVPNLQELIIKKCEKMEEIVSTGLTEKDVVVGEHIGASLPHNLQIIFPRLEHLELHSLPNLTTLCPSDFLLFLEPSLKTKDITDCPNLLEPSNNNPMS